MPGISRHVALLVSLLVVALALRLATAVWWESRLPSGVKFGFPDSESYWVLGERIARGEPYEFGGDGGRVFRTPGYPLLLASLFAMRGGEPPVMWARAASVLLGALAVGGVYWLARLLFDRTAGLVAAAIAVVYPGAIAMSVLVLSEALFCPLMLLQLILWILAWRSSRPVVAFTLALFAGGLAGAATLTRPSWLLFTPLAVLVALACYGQRGRQLRVAAFLIAGLLAAMTPWWVRNYMVTGHFVPTTLQVGASLYDGLNPRATGASNMWWGRSAPGRADDRDEYARDRSLRDAALGWAWRNPGKTMRLAAVKFVRMWNVWPNEPKFSRWPLRLGLLLTYVPVVALAGCGGWWFVRRGWPYAMCLVPAVYFTILHTMFVGSIRYRQPAMLLLMVLAAGAVVTMWRNRRALRKSDRDVGAR